MAESAATSPMVEGAAANEAAKRRRKGVAAGTDMGLKRDL